MTLPDIPTETFPAGFLNLRRKRISIAEEYIVFEKTSLFGSREIRLEWSNIRSVCYGAEWLPGMYWTTGYRVQVKFKSVQGEIYTFGSTAIYGIGFKQLNVQMNQVIMWLWENQLNKRVNNLLERFEKVQPLLFPGIQLNGSGVLLNNVEIPWNQVDMKEYHGFFYITDKQEPRTTKKFSYLHDWDAVIIYSVIKTILAHFQQQGS